MLTQFLILINQVDNFDFLKHVNKFKFLKYININNLFEHVKILILMTIILKSTLKILNLTNQVNNINFLKYCLQILIWFMSTLTYNFDFDDFKFLKT